MLILLGWQAYLPCGNVYLNKMLVFKLRQSVLDPYL